MVGAAVSCVHRMASWSHLTPVLELLLCLICSMVHGNTYGAIVAVGCRLSLSARSTLVKLQQIRRWSAKVGFVSAAKTSRKREFNNLGASRIRSPHLILSGWLLRRRQVQVTNITTLVSLPSLRVPLLQPIYFTNDNTQ